MNTLNKLLLGGAALCALTVAPAVAEQKNPGLHFTALHGGRVLYKSKFNNGHRCGDDSCTIYAYTSVAASNLRKWVRLSGTFYKLNNSGTVCSNPEQHVKAPKKSVYGKVRATTATYSLGCVSGPTTFYGTDYKLTDPAGFGKADTFTSKLHGQFTNGSHKYKGTLYIETLVSIGTE